MANVITVTMATNTTALIRDPLSLLPAVSSGCIDTTCRVQSSEGHSYGSVDSAHWNAHRFSDNFRDDYTPSVTIVLGLQKPN